MSHLFRGQGIIRENILEVIPNVYQVTFRGVNVLVIAEAELTIVDTGFRANVPKIIDFIRSLGRSPEEISLIILTHNHFDHASGLGELRKVTHARVAAHKADISDVNGPLPYPQFVQKTIRVRPFSALRSFLGVGARDVDIRLSGGEVLTPLGGLKVIHAPGHTPGSICLLSPQHRLLIVGDALLKHGTTVRFPHKSASTNLPQAIESAKGLVELEFDIVCFGHGQPLMENGLAKLQALVARAED
jgi:glyoxylase-like metal-dependent hydrolase (beta-lactamase superfamily II)